MQERAIGKVSHYYGHIQVAALDLLEPLRVGERIHIVGHSTDVQQVVESMEVEHQTVQEGRPGQPVAIKVTVHVHQHDRVYKVVD